MSAWFSRGSNTSTQNQKEPTQLNKSSELSHDSKKGSNNSQTTKKQSSQSAKSNTRQSKEKSTQSANVTTNSTTGSLSRSKDNLPVLPDLISPEMKKKIMEEFSDDSDEEDGVKADYNSMLDKTLQLYKRTMQSNRLVSVNLCLGTSSEIVTDVKDEESVEARFKNQIIDITNHRCLICLEKVNSLCSF